MDKRAKSIALRKAHPEWTLAQIAAKVEASRQYVHAVLTAEGLPTIAARPEPEITPQMIDAGVSALRGKSRVAEDLVADIYKAMFISR